MNPIKILFLNIICILLLACFTVFSWQYLMVNTLNFKNDYKTFYLAMKDSNNPYKASYYAHINKITIVNGKKNIQLLPPTSAINMNTPTMSLLLKSMVSLHRGLVLDSLCWILCSLIGGVIGFAIAVRYLDMHRIETIYFAPFLLVFWLSWPSLYNLSLGQVVYFVLPVLSLGFLLDYRGHQRSAAIILGLLASLKLFFLIFILLFLIRKQWRLSILFIAAFLVFFFLPLLYFSWKDYIDFYRIAQNDLMFFKRSMLTMNASLFGLFSRAITFFHWTINYAYLRFTILMASIYVLFRCFKYDTYFLRLLPDFSNELRFSFLIVLAIFLSPLGWFYYFLFLLIPVLVISKIATRYRLSKTFFILCALALLFPYLGWLHAIPPSPFFYPSFYGVFLGLLCWFLTLCSAANAVHRGVPAPIDQPKKLMTMWVLQALLCVALLSVNYGMPYFLDVVNTSAAKSGLPVVMLQQKAQPPVDHH